MRNTIIATLLILISVNVVAPPSVGMPHEASMDYLRRPGNAVSRVPTKTGQASCLSPGCAAGEDDRQDACPTLRITDRAFSLIEVMMVMAIIGTLAAMMLPYSISFLVLWSVFFFIWTFVFGLPVGPASPTYYTPG